MSKKNGILSSNAFYTLLSIVLGFIVGAILLSVAKINPLLQSIRPEVWM